MMAIINNKKTNNDKLRKQRFVEKLEKMESLNNAGGNVKRDGCCRKQNGGS